MRKAYRDRSCGRSCERQRHRRFPIGRCILRSEKKIAALVLNAMFLFLRKSKLYSRLHGVYNSLLVLSRTSIFFLGPVVPVVDVIGGSTAGKEKAEEEEEVDATPVEEAIRKRELRQGDVIEVVSDHELVDCQHTGHFARLCHEL